MDKNRKSSTVKFDAESLARLDQFNAAINALTKAVGRLSACEQKAVTLTPTVQVTRGDIRSDVDIEAMVRHIDEEMLRRGI